MKRKNISLYIFALLFMYNNAKAMEPVMQQDNTKIINYTQDVVEYRSNRPIPADRLYSSKAVEEKIQFILISATL